MAVRTLVVWCPDWPVSALGFAATDAVAVTEGGRVLACSEAGRAQGVSIGLRPREAQSRCPGLSLCRRDLAAEHRLFEAVVAAVATVSPAVEVTRPGLCALATRGPARYFGGEEALCRHVRQLAQAAMPHPGVPEVGVGIADGRFAAALAARRCQVVPPRSSRRFLAGYPLSTLGLADLADLMGRLGIHTLGDFATLSSSSVLSRFGPQVATAHRLARGEDATALRSRVAPLKISATAELDPPAERADIGAFVARSIASEVMEQLSEKALTCTLLRVEVETEHAEQLSRLWRSDEGFAVESMVDRLRWQLEGWLSGSAGARMPTAGITLLRLVVEEVAPAGGSQRSFWGGASEGDRLAFKTLDRLRGMLGPQAVFTAGLRGGLGPADRVELKAWGDPSDNDKQPRRGDDGPWPGHHPLPPPAIVYQSPLPAEVTGSQGAALRVSARGALSAEPARMSLAGSPWMEVVAWAGPWMAEECWWDPSRHHRRARLQVLAGDGSAHLCMIEEGRWWLEATYD